MPQLGLVSGASIPVVTTTSFPYSNTQYRTFQATVSGTGAVSATVVMSMSNDGVAWIPAATFNLSGTTVATDGINTLAPWQYIQTNISTISGTGAAVTVTMGYD